MLLSKPMSLLKMQIHVGAEEQILERRQTFLSFSILHIVPNADTVCSCGCVSCPQAHLGISEDIKSPEDIYSLSTTWPYEKPPPLDLCLSHLKSVRVTSLGPEGGSSFH